MFSQARQYLENQVMQKLDIKQRVNARNNSQHCWELICPFARSLTNDIFPSGIQHFVIFAAQPYGLPLKEVTIAQYLKALGYKTHAVGKVVIMTIFLKCFDCNAYENQCNF